MSEEELRRAYGRRRILIEVSRILSPSFRAQGVYLTGAQVEMLRNITAHLNHRSTWVDTYHDTYYMMADDQDYSDILEIVADLEVKLMANENTPLGYWVPWSVSLAGIATADGAKVIHIEDVEEGEVLWLEAVSWQNQTGVRGSQVVSVKTGINTVKLAQVPIPLAGVPIMWNGLITLQDGDTLTVTQFSAIENDVFVGAARGYKMKVPV